METGDRRWLGAWGLAGQMLMGSVDLISPAGGSVDPTILLAGDTYPVGTQ